MQDKKNNIINFFSNLDKFIFFSVILLIFVGIFAVFSASTRVVEKYDLPDQSKALRCLLDYVEENELEWDDMFATIRCNRC